MKPYSEGLRHRYTYAVRQELAKALEKDHCWSDCGNACDIHKAWEEGLYLWAANLLTGATDEGVEDTTKIFNSIPYSDEDLMVECEALLACDHVVCDSCNATCWTEDRDATCGSCGAALPCQWTHMVTGEPCVLGYKHRGFCQTDSGRVWGEDEYGDVAPEQCLVEAPDSRGAFCVEDKGHDGPHRSNTDHEWGEKEW